MRRDNGAALDGGQASAAASGAKGMMPFARPFLDYVLSVLADAGITEAVLVIGPPPEDRRDSRVLRGDGAPDGACRIRFAVQPEPRGTADALLRGARRRAARTVSRAQLRQLLSRSMRAPRSRRWAAPDSIAFDADTLVRESGIEAERVLRYALVDADADGWLRAIREKPDRRPSARAIARERWVSMNLWSFTPRIFDACARVVPSARGELELQDAVTIAMRDFGERFRVSADARRACSISRAAPMSRSSVASGDDLAATVTPSVIRRYVVPGRVELVGKHVDYAGGRSLTCAVDLALHVDAETDCASRCSACDAGPEARRRRHAARRRTSTPTGASWSVYVAAVARRFARDFPHFRRGVSVRLRGDLPDGAGLSSSSALIVALAHRVGAMRMMRRTTSMESSRSSSSLARAEYFAAIETGAPYGEFAGEEGVGVRGGAQDPIAIICGDAGHVSQFSYLPARLERRVPWPADYVLAIGVSGVHAIKDRQRAAPIQSSRRGDARARSTMECRETGRHDDTVAEALSSGPDAGDRLSRVARAQSSAADIGAEYLVPRLAQFREEVEVIVPGVGDALRDRDWRSLGALVDRSHALATTCARQSSARDRSPRSQRARTRRRRGLGVRRGIRRRGVGDGPRERRGRVSSPAGAAATSRTIRAVSRIPSGSSPARWPRSRSRLTDVASQRVTLPGSGVRRTSASAAGVIPIYASSQGSAPAQSRHAHCPSR